METQATQITFDAQQILIHAHSGDIPYNWHVFHTSRQKLILLIGRLSSYIGLVCAILAITSLLISYQHPAFPSTAPLLFFGYVATAIISIIMLTLVMLMSMKNVVLVITPEGFVYGNSKRGLSIICVNFQDVTQMTADGDLVWITFKNRQIKMRFYYRLLEDPAQEVTLKLQMAYAAFRANQGTGPDVSNAHP